MKQVPKALLFGAKTLKIQRKLERLNPLIFLGFSRSLPSPAQNGSAAGWGMLKS